MQRFALELQGGQLDDAAKVGSSELQLNGAGVRSAGLGKEVYVAGLYLQSRSQNAEKTLASKQPKRLVMVNVDPAVKTEKYRV